MKSGSRFGHFEVIAPLGSGGMGVVYRARDMRLGREVALKVLPDGTARDRERLARFEREACLLATLQHPAIASIYGLEIVEDQPALILELIEGPTLGERMAKGPCPIAEAIGIAQKVVDALDAAHEKGIVHRDLKPDNIKLGADGAVKVLDFGLAAMLDAGSTDTSQANTRTAGMTMSGTILGTAGYMAPEQAVGEPVDHRADVWAFGVVVWELLAGRRLFGGRSRMETHAALLHGDIDWNALPSQTPPALLRLLRRTLQRDRKLRLRDVADARPDLEEALAESREGVVATSRSLLQGPSLQRSILAGAAILGAGLVTAAILLGGAARQRGAPATVVRSELPLADSVRLAGWASPVIALSPDGRRVAYVGSRSGQLQHLYVHDLSTGETRLVPESETAEGPFFSPDGRSVGFAVGSSLLGIASPQLMRYSTETGLTQKLCDLLDYFGGSWAPDGTIYFVGDQFGGVMRVPAGGGRPEPAVERFRVSDSDSAIRLVMWPQLLPGGRHLMVTDYGAATDDRAAVLDLQTRELRPLGIDAEYVRYLSNGQLAYVRRDRSLMTIGFDARSRTTRGQPTLRAIDVSTSGNLASVMDVSGNGMLAYTKGYLRGSNRELLQVVRVTADGASHPLRFEPDEIQRVVRLSADGSRGVSCTYDGEVWVHDLARGARRLVHQGQWTGDPVWSPDGRSIAFADKEGSRYSLYVVAADGSAPARRIWQATTEMHPTDFTPDGGHILYSAYEPAGRSDPSSSIFVLAADGSGTPRRIVANGQMQALSPDGRWIAYNAVEGGRLVAYVRRVEAPGPGVQIPGVTGRDLRWAHDGRELYFREGERLVAVPLRGTSEPEPGEAQSLFTIADLRSYDTFPGRREFLATTRVPTSGIQTRLSLVTNWFAELRGSSPPAR